MSARLELALDQGGGRVALPRAGVLSIGSAKDSADLFLEGPGVAAVHCVIGRLKGGGWALKDLGSPAGTRVNGAAVKQLRLSAGDRIELGSRVLAVVDPAAPTPPPVELVRSDPTPSAEALPQLRGYRLERRLGRGGMGAVYLAVQESLDRRVALKVLNPRLSADADFVRRFQAEARAAAALSHPNVVTVHDVWEENDHHWLAMEFMERGNLEDRLASAGRLDVAEVLAVLIDAASGLAYAELRGVVHRDIKPANLMQDGFGLTKIADLGLATHLEAELRASGDTRVFGTPHFIAPEQARGEAVDGRSDLYSLGATAYRLLTGRTPFEGATTREILRGHLTEPPRPPRELVPELPAGLEAVVLRLLQKDPAARFQSARELLDELGRLRAGLDQAGASAGRPGARLLAVLAVLLVLGGAAWFALRSSPQPDGEGRDAIAGGAPGTGAAGTEADLDGSPPSDPADPRPADEPAPFDDDAALKALEREARSRYESLPGDLLPEERAASLRELVAAFDGTTAAGRWREELAALEASARTTSTEGARREQAGAATLAAIAAVGRDPGRPLAALLARLRQVHTPPALAADPAFLQARAAAVAAVLDARREAAVEALVEVDALASAGRFDEVGTRLTALVAALDPDGDPEREQGPPPAEDDPPEDDEAQVTADAPETEAEEPQAEPAATGLAGPAPITDPLLASDTVRAALETLAGLRAELEARLAGLELERERWRIGREHAQARTLATALAGGGALGAGLRRLDLVPVAEGLEQLAGERADTDAAAFAAGLAAELARARGALDALIAAFDQGGWRRKSIVDPRPAAGHAPLTVVGADAEGLTVEASGGVERLSWSTFGTDPDALDQLFHQRLARDYSADELIGIAALLRLAAVQQAVLWARAPLAGAPSSAPDTGWRGGFDEARPWAEAAGRLEPLDRELQATSLLASALDAAHREAWATAVAETETLLERHRDTLLVRLLSDGRPWLALPTGKETGHAEGAEAEASADDPGDE